MHGSKNSLIKPTDKVTCRFASTDQISRGRRSGQKAPAAGQSGQKAPAAGQSGQKAPASGQSGQKAPASGRVFSNSSGSVAGGQQFVDEVLIIDLSFFVFRDFQEAEQLSRFLCLQLLA